MLKRKYGDRSNWKRIVDREYIQDYIHLRDYKGFVTLLKMNKVTEPLSISYGDKEVCIVEAGYSWLQHFPDGKHYSITTTFNQNGEVVQWYIDICREIGVENNVPWMDDLYLDIVVLSTGEVLLLDEEELEEALLEGIIDDSLYDLAWQEANNILASIEKGTFKILDLTPIHKNILLEKCSSTEKK
ncbi:DUF402 domain-containing protein [Ornithinibacillus salinisoli]|uniref:DUF402 domain-containing protein n=1 Tax=Ornithinibacillus salinisoli TaxID=1848459 RepID=A0ABW4VYQ2_9BACI